MFTAVGSAPSPATVTVDYATANGTAVAGPHTNSDSDCITDVCASDLKPISVNILGDYVVEADESFALNLSNPVNATVGTPVAYGIILNDEIGRASCRERV